MSLFYFVEIKDSFGGILMMCHMGDINMKTIWQAAIHHCVVAALQPGPVNSCNFMTVFSSSFCFLFVFVL